MRLLLAITIVVCCEDVEEYLIRLRDQKRYQE